MWKRWTFIILGLVLVMTYLVGACCFIPDPLPSKSCEEIIICVQDSLERQYVTALDLETTLKHKGLYPRGEVLDLVSTQSIEDCLRAHPYVCNAECYKSHTGKLYVTATQRIPKFRVLGTESYFVDIDRQIMPSGITTATHVPIVTGKVTKDFAQNDLYDFVDYLEDDLRWRKKIKQIHLPDSLHIELVPLQGDYRIQLGRLEDYEAKLDKYEIWLEEIEKVKMKDYREVDLRYKGQIVCR